MTKIKAALLGFGTVGQGVYEAIKSHQEKLQERLVAEVEIVAVLIKEPYKKREIDPSVLITTNFEDILNIPDLDVVFEAIVGETPSFTYLSKAIEKGCHVITANKVMFAKYGKLLLEKGRKKNVYVGYEATTAGGVPIIRTISQQLQVNDIQRVQAVLNGTSNFILTEMREKGLSFQKALESAQLHGYAEADPANDIEGKDAFFKLMILSDLVFGAQPDWDAVEVEGIQHITVEDIQAAKTQHLRYKHIADIYRYGRTLKASVKPVLVAPDHALYSIEGVENAVTIYASLVDKITISGPGAGKFPTASAMIEDFVSGYQIPRYQFTLNI
ncbi:homoserine dehydrogenase [Bacillus ginsengihumi]|uniref:Homoserine dehydrogenase n=1 Tax=Heyndrickxia ginsengihumi TaxID=363870 RepID=A0A0A6VFT4_9BACI|nr:homoserine dehydrogenase [Heyndrickxia ginsengihumi]KHD86441.1 homoserine dehydrogenase [Heyndrickxia ginsengihumi]NEY19186.1 homoserine dehydrogenase [Heyndrickxia ginsengihumi]